MVVYKFPSNHLLFFRKSFHSETLYERLEKMQRYLPLEFCRSHISNYFILEEIFFKILRELDGPIIAKHFSANMSFLSISRSFQKGNFFFKLFFLRKAFLFLCWINRLLIVLETSKRSFTNSLVIIFCSFENHFIRRHFMKSGKKYKGPYLWIFADRIFLIILFWRKFFSRFFENLMDLS